SVSRRSRWERARSRIVRPRRDRQRVFTFIERSQRLGRIFKIVIAGLTLGLVAGLLAALPTGRYLAGWLNTHGRWAALRMVGLEPDRDAIDAEWRRKRIYDMESARAQLGATFQEYDPP